MSSPFPGMDPYLEGYLWPDVHHSLAIKIRQLLAPLIGPRYVGRIKVQVVYDDTPEADIGIKYPDIVVRRRGAAQVAIGASAQQTFTAPLTLPIPAPIEVRLASVEIRDTAKNQLVTCVEILSPVNKREKGLVAYRQKRRRLYETGIHLIEIDMLRRGTRPFAHPRIADAYYTIMLTRAGARTVDVWPLTIRQSMPVVPVPLRAPDADVRLNLGVVLSEIYDDAAYDVSIDYDQSPPPPTFSPDDQTWMRELLG